MFICSFAVRKSEEMGGIYCSALIRMWVLYRNRTTEHKNIEYNQYIWLHLLQIAIASAFVSPQDPSLGTSSTPNATSLPRSAGNGHMFFNYRYLNIILIFTLVFHSNREKNLEKKIKVFIQFHFHDSLWCDGVSRLNAVVHILHGCRCGKKDMKTCVEIVVELRLEHFECVGIM